MFKLAGRLECLRTGRLGDMLRVGSQSASTAGNCGLGLADPGEPSCASAALRIESALGGILEPPFGDMGNVRQLLPDDDGGKVGLASMPV
mmetsp:Transcript_12316/g.28863  ORF Transcript_12316/g.28863 Transcript_12316/m.28863 type:complete len:90 (-) Transcript_12316:366-635(-)